MPNIEVMSQKVQTPLSFYCHAKSRDYVHTIVLSLIGCFQCTGYFKIDIN
jgi:hypothetical protein